jgi:adenylate kinase
LPNSNRSDDEIKAAEQPAERESGSQRAKLRNLAPGHPSSPRYTADGVRPLKSADTADRPSSDVPADGRSGNRVADAALSRSDPADVSEPLLDSDHVERDVYVDATLADAHKAGLATDHEYVSDAKRRIWAVERSELHGEIVRDVYAKADSVPCEGKAILVGGLPGAGKTTVLKGVAGIDLSKYLMINPDDMKEEMASRGMVPELRGLSPMEASDLTHEESSDLAKRLAIRAYADKKNVIWDVTMSSVASTQRRISDLRSAGYDEIEGIFVDIPVEVSVRRAEERHREGHEEYVAGRGLGGRYIPPDRIRALADQDSGSINRATFEQVKPEFARWRGYDNSEDGRPAKLADASAFDNDDREEGR